MINWKSICFFILTSFDGCRGSCNTFDDLSDRSFPPTKTEDVNLKTFHTITGINESKSLVNNVSCDCRCIMSILYRNLFKLFFTNPFTKLNKKMQEKYKWSKIIH